MISMKDICDCAVGLNTARLQIPFSDKDTFESIDPKQSNFLWEHKNMSI